MNEEKFKYNLGIVLQKYRLEAHLTQEQLAESSSLSTNYISDIERGKKSISAYALYKLTCALNISISDLFKEV